MQKTDSVKQNFVHKLNFDIRDTFLAARLGLNARNMWVFWKGFALIWIVLTFFVYTGFYAAGDNIVERFLSSRLGPVPDELFMSSVPAVILLISGILLALFVFIRTYAKVSRLTFEQIRGDQFFTESDATRLLQGSWKSAVIAPLVILLGVGLAILAIYLVGLFSKIPFIGSWILGLLAAPLLFLGLFVVFALTVFVLSITLGPVITATTKGDTFELLFELFSTITAQPIRLFNWFFTGSILRVIGIVFFFIFASGSVTVVSSVLEKTANITGFSTSIESSISTVAPELAPFYSSILSPVASTSHLETNFSPVTETLVICTGVALFLVLLSYWFSSGSALWTIIYLGARFNRDREDLLIRADEEDQREFVRLANALKSEKQK